MQSSTVSGLLVGSLIEKGSNHDQEFPIQSGDGWVMPQNLKTKVSILLTNGKRIDGKYEKTVKQHDGEKTLDVVLIKKKKLTLTIPILVIAYTKVFKENRNKAQAGMMVGLGIDILLITTVLIWYN